MSNLKKNICLIVIFSGLFIPSASLAMEMSSKRDCAICHIMWLNDFRTDQKTLIEWQPGNVLMKDTQGVVSSEDICYSCHDGYVNDSRSIVWKNFRHKVFVKPSENVRIPSNLPLSNRDEIYCGTCHSAHGVGAGHDPERPGFTSFFREPEVDSNLCERCHVNETDFRRTGGHPLKTAPEKPPGFLVGMGAKLGRKGGKIICQTCHKVHGALGEKITVVENRGSEMCMLCHDRQKLLIGTKHDLRVSLPEEKNIKGRTPSESGPCGACHAPHRSAGNKLWAGRYGTGDTATRMCTACHDPNLGRPAKHIGDHSHPVNVDPGAEYAAGGGLPLYSADLTKGRRGRIQCFTCHDVHRWAPGSTDDRGGNNVEGDASNSFLRLSNASSSDLCIACHRDKIQTITSDHNLTVTAPEEKNIQNANAWVSGPCGACHVPHNAAGKRLWSRPVAADENPSVRMCTGCHRPDGAARAKPVGDNDHPVAVNFENFEKIDDRLPLFGTDGGTGPRTTILCLTCHEPHTWDPRKSGVIPDYRYKNMEGDAADSFLRKANFPSSDLCKICHADHARIDGTPHDLNVTAPQAKNLLGQTVKSSGQCGACHLVHNSPNRLKLWARPYGPISEEQGPMDALCTSCHRTGSNAQNKIPRTAVHPKGKLINNILWFDKKNKDYTLIFDKNGREVNTGDISCPSCHNAHRWNLEDNKSGQGTPRRLEGSFLRTLSFKTVCVDCHGSEALVRYQYFHDPEKRSPNRRR